MKHKTLSAEEQSQVQSCLDRLSWVKIKTGLIYSRKLPVKLRAARILLEMFRTQIEASPSIVPRVTGKELGRLLGLKDGAGQQAAKALREAGLLKDGRPTWPDAKGLWDLSPHPTYVPDEERHWWFHTAPRLLVANLAPHALLIYFHLKHKEQRYWVEVRKERASSTTEIADALRMSRRDAIAGIKELEELGVLIWTVATSSCAVCIPET